MSDAFSPAQLEQLKAIVREGVHEALEDIGLPVDGDKRADTREAVGFLFKMKRIWDATVTRIGNSVLTALIAIVFAIVGLGFWQWIGRGGQ